MQWLERQSMLAKVPELTAQVSGTPFLWGNGGGRTDASRLALLLDACGNWLEVDPSAVIDERPLFKALARPEILPFLRETALGGVYVAPDGEGDGIWLEGGESPPQKGDGPDGGTRVVSLSFGSGTGGPEAYEALLTRLEASQVQAGGDLLPAATGVGPDFMLQARVYQGFAGLYVLLPVPSKAWGDLPPDTGEWRLAALSPEAVERLSKEGTLPPAFARDGVLWMEPAGWGATGKVRGFDGNPRRWVYRFAGDVRRPVLLWQDPSGQARRLLSAAVIRRTGLLRQTLTGVRMESLLGLDVGEGARIVASNEASREQAQGGEGVPGNGEERSGTAVESREGRTAGDAGRSDTEGVQSRAGASSDGGDGKAQGGNGRARHGTGDGASRSGDRKETPGNDDAKGSSAAGNPSAGAEDVGTKPRAAVPADAEGDGRPGTVSEEGKAKGTAGGVKGGDGAKSSRKADGDGSSASGDTEGSDRARKSSRKSRKSDEEGVSASEDGEGSDRARKSSRKSRKSDEEGVSASEDGEGSDRARKSSRKSRKSDEEGVSASEDGEGSDRARKSSRKSRKSDEEGVSASEDGEGSDHSRKSSRKSRKSEEEGVSASENSEGSDRARKSSRKSRKSEEEGVSASENPEGSDRSGKSSGKSRKSPRDSDETPSDKASEAAKAAKFPQIPPSDVARVASLGPGMEAMAEVGRQIRRYGGWSFQADVLPVSLTPAVLQAVDCARDAATPAAAACALLTGDAGILVDVLSEHLADEVDQRRLVRGYGDWRGVDLRPLLAMPGGGDAVSRAVASLSLPPGTLWIPGSQATLAARALGREDDLARTCLLLAAFRIGLPGLAFVSLQDLTGALPPGSGNASGVAGVPLWNEGRATALPKARLAFGTIPKQLADPGSFLRRMCTLLQARVRHGVPAGTLERIDKGPAGCIATLTRLPGGGLWIVAGNFSDKDREMSVWLPRRGTPGPARDVLDGNRSFGVGDGVLRLELPARGARHIVIGGAS
jgi:hypothetical protein